MEDAYLGLYHDCAVVNVQHNTSTREHVEEKEVSEYNRKGTNAKS